MSLSFYNIMYIRYKLKVEYFISSLNVDITLEQWFQMSVDSIATSELCNLKNLCGYVYVHTVAGF
jgi:hypothetical protein